MVQKIFVFGRPGAGKSTIIQFLQATMQTIMPIYYCSDYPIAFDMYMRDCAKPDGDRRYFQPAIPERPQAGFNIINPYRAPTFRWMLEALEREGQARIVANRRTGHQEIVALEFARRNYRRALRQFTPDFLEDALFILTEAPVDVCMERIYRRAAANGEHFMGEQIVRGYYGLDNFDLMRGVLINGQPVYRIWNDGITRDELGEKVAEFIETRLLPALACEQQMVSLELQLDSSMVQ